MSYHRFIGGLHDGEWHDVRRNDGLFLPPIWTVRESPKLMAASVDPATIDPRGPSMNSRLTNYVPLPVHIGKEEVVTFFIEQSMKPSEAFLRLAACYRPNPDSKP
jgi:hypothetical protein